MEEKKTIIAYKGFDKGLKCKGFQYEVGKEYEMEEEIKVCEKVSTPAKTHWTY